jgi:hypothetical protein
MIAMIAMLLTAALWLIAAVHLYWGVGGVWPALDGQSLSRMVVGTRGINRMPSPVACQTVALVLAAAGLLPLIAVGLLGAPWPQWLTTLGLAGGTTVFLGRGIASYTPAFRRLAPDEPFATYDKRLYAPLCLLLGAGFLILLFR